MTVIGRDRYSEEMDRSLRYRPAPCQGCGATTLNEAGRMCRPTSNPSGEYSCAGDGEGFNPFGKKWTTDGQACQLTNKSAKAEAMALSAWCDDQARAMGYNVPAR
jgi:hypothetical protein